MFAFALQFAFASLISPNANISLLSIKTDRIGEGVGKRRDPKAGQGAEKNVKNI